MEYPKIFLAIDNCFASKRWTVPSEWMAVVKDLGICYVEASADNECDPLYMGGEYLDDWVSMVKRASEETGVRVVNLYSGHGTYATLGLAHTDERIRDRFLEEWLKPMSRTAGEFGAGLGFFCHAFPDSILQDIDKYAMMENDLYGRLAKLADYSTVSGCANAGVEQMYTPHQIPWTIKGAYKLLGEVNKRSRNPFYITIDLGHQSGQGKFMRPGHDRIKELLGICRAGKKNDNMWLGPLSAYELFNAALRKSVCSEDAEIEKIEGEMDRYPHMFAEYDDGDTYVWLEKLGGYSPIVHLQQTNGRSSSHLPFTKEHNETGIISGEKVLNSLLRAYQAGDSMEFMPEKCGDIYLTLEMFSGTSEMNNDIIRRLKESVGYWRTYVPEDGLTLDKLVETGDCKHG